MAVKYLCNLQIMLPYANQIFDLVFENYDIYSVMKQIQFDTKVYLHLE